MVLQWLFSSRGVLLIDSNRIIFRPHDTLRLDSMTRDLLVLPASTLKIRTTLDLSVYFWQHVGQRNLLGNLEEEGFFTKALLDVLITCGPDNLTYKDLVQSIPTLPR